MNIEALRSDILNTSRVTFALSGGPGGQNVNKVNTRVLIHIPIHEMDSLTPTERARILETLRNRINSEGCLLVESSSTRSQFRNRQEALRIALELMVEALKVPARRRPTRPSGASKRRRLDSKKRKSTVKKNRGKVEPE